MAPNVMLTLDDSGSMAFAHMPENVFAGGTFITPNPVNSQTVRWDPNDNFMIGVNFIGQVPGIIGSTNWVLRALRSPDTNTVFYNPDILYQPWLTNDGVTRRGLSPANAAFRNPMNPGGGGVINLTATTAVPAFTPAVIPVTAMVNGTRYVIASLGTTSVANWDARGTDNTPSPGEEFVNAGGATTGTGTVYSTDPAWGNKPWCFAVNANTGNNTLGGPTHGCAVARPAFTHDPGVYFRLGKTGSVYNNLTVSTNYTAYSINTPGGTYPKVAARTDCLGAVGPTGCGQVQERQNYANWFTYYRNRNLLARGGLMEAFGVEAAPVAAGNFVIGSRYAITSVGTTDFMSLGATANTVDTVFTATQVGNPLTTGTARAIVMRLGIGRINQATNAPVDGVNTAILEDDPVYGGGGVRDFNRARKNNLFRWLEDATAGGGTPLVGALQANGVYYSRTDSRGPWTDNPAVNTNVVANNKTCRRSYTFLTTDGYWTTAGTAGNADNTAGATITSTIVLPALVPPYAPYTYTPAPPYSDAWSNTLADTAMRYWKTDLQPATNNAVPPVGNNISFWQNMTTYTIGLGVRGTLNPATDLPALTAGTLSWPQAFAGGTGANVDDLWHAALNSRGQYFSVKDPQEMATAIRTALASATAEKGSTAGIAAASTTLTGTNRKYKLDFYPGNWNGDVTAYKLNALGAVVSTEWTASTQMALTPFSSRNIVTFDTSPGTWSGIAFNWTSIPPAGQAAMGPVATMAPVTPGSSTAFMDFLKGDHANEGSTGLGIYRSRLNTAGQSFILGDSINASPALIKSNFDGNYVDTLFGGVATAPTSYANFKVAKAARNAVLFTGGNDGMLHAFQDSQSVPPAATDGREIFAYVPRAVYGNLEKLADKNYGTTALLPHQYFVDGPLAEADAYVKAPGATGASWRNYLMGTLGAGGRAVFALDVTDTANLNASSVRWELSSADDPDMGYVLSNVRIGVLPNDRWVAVFGNGFGSTGGTLGVSRAVLFVVDLEDYASNNPTVRAGAIHKTVLDTTGNNGLGGVTLIPNMTTQRIERIYVGDQKGKLWKLNYITQTGVPVANAPWFDAAGGAPFFSATDAVGTAQPITSSPAVFKGTKAPTASGGMGSTGYVVTFGTGKLFSTADATDTSIQSVYSVWDKAAGPSGGTESVAHPMNRSNLVARTLTSFAGASGLTYFSVTGAAVNYGTSQRGWYIDLNATLTGGRVVYPTQVAGPETVFFSAVAPVQGNPAACESASGTGLGLLTRIDTGVDNPSASGRTFDTNGDGNINASDSSASGVTTKADGVDVVARSPGNNGDDPGSDLGGGAPVGDCTGAKCTCVPSPLCASNQCLVVIISAAGSIPTCVDRPSSGTRVWRRIINPPI
ncbi:MAG: PilC/PilY family type IV pilus protein [Pseudomonadota bacterium]